MVLILSACGGGLDESLIPAPGDTGDLNSFLAASWERTLDRDPLLRARRGIKRNQQEWPDLSDDKAAADHAEIRRDLTTLRSDFERAALNEADRLSYDLFEAEAEFKLEGFRWRFYEYPVNHRFGYQSRLPNYLINYHPVASTDDAAARSPTARTGWRQIPG